MSALIDGNDQIDAYCDYIAASPLGDPAEFIVDTWLDEFKLADKSIMLAPGKGWHKYEAEFRLASLRQQLLYVLRANLDELELASNAARLGGEVDFSDWLEGGDE